MSRPTNVDEYKMAWKELSDSPYKIGSCDRIEPVLSIEEPYDVLKPRYFALKQGDVYTLIGVGDNNYNIVSAFEMNEDPEMPTYDDLSVNGHARDRMAERNITTGTLRKMYDNYLWWDRLEYRTYKIVSIIDGVDYHSIVDLGESEIETVWRN